MPGIVATSSRPETLQMAVSAIVIWRNQLLLVRRTPPIPEQWAPPGGKVNPGEHLLMALRRETREEIGVALNPVRFVAELELHMRAKRYVLVAFLCDIMLEPERLNAATDALETRWLSLENARRLPLAPGVHDVLDRLTLR